ncbi:MAG: hypothetical protein NZ843_00490 [Fimbriimonadales bacterium]|nr:hypothetical protein [Fimbriimonadales bacterium]
MATILEGLWEEIVAQGDALKGKRVRVEVLEATPPEVAPASSHPLERILGIAQGGPADLSVRHDEYLYPKR